MGPRCPGPNENRRAQKRGQDGLASAIFVGARRGDDSLKTNHLTQQQGCDSVCAGAILPPGRARRSDRPMTKILYVEDNEDDVYLLRMRLGQIEGFDFGVAKDGAAANAAVAADAPDLILMDLNVPVIDGWEATRRLKANAKTAQIPVIALTANAMAGDRERALAAGCDDFDTKPIEFDRLLGKVRRLLGRRS